MDLLKRIKDRAPEYDSRYFDMILNFTIEQGSGMGRTSEEERWKQGKYFSTRYEMYMYASLLGLKKDYNLPIAAGTNKKKFIEIKSWQPYDVADYVIMGVLAKSDIDFNELENMQEEDVEKKITGLKSLLEGYANGGFDIIRSKMDEEESFFLNDNCFLDLLDE
nr:hypothetical protein [uncultured Psychroserpens sp.]